MGQFPGSYRDVSQAAEHKGTKMDQLIKLSNPIPMKAFRNKIVATHSLSQEVQNIGPDTLQMGHLVVTHEYTVKVL